MKNIILLTSLLAVLGGCGTSKKAVAPTESSYWRKDSEKLFRIFGKRLAIYNPEEALAVVSEKYEPLTRPYSKNYENLRYATAYRFKKTLDKYIQNQKDRELRLDAKLLEELMQVEMMEVEMNRKIGVVPFVPATEFILNQISVLIDPQAPQSRINNGMIKFRSYVRGTDKQMPFIIGFTAHALNRMEQLAQKRMRGFWPTESEIKNYIATTSENIKQIEKVLSIWKTDDWKRDLEALKEQDKDFVTFLKKKVLPYARKNHVLPADLYAFYLRTYGIKTNPSELIDVAKEDYKKTYKEYKNQAAVVARQRKLSTTSPVDVVNILKSFRLRNMPELVQHYKDSFTRLAEITSKNNLLTIVEPPPYIIREPMPIEAGASVPFVQRTLPFSRKIITPQIVAILCDPNDNSYDHAFKESVVNFVARQGVPGSILRYFYHDALNPTSIRFVFATTNHNSEGWAHYAEDLVYPYLTEEEKLIFLQRKLLRQARMFLDAEYHLGRITSEKMKDVYFYEIGMSEKSSNSEIQTIKKYPGALATSYHGYLLLKKLRAQFVKGKVTEKCFNDYIVRSGVLPYEEISDRLSEVLFCEDV